jgi:hypothetical protein
MTESIGERAIGPMRCESMDEPILVSEAGPRLIVDA